MFHVHGFVDGKLTINWRMQHIPANGDTVRLSDHQYAKVTEVIWCVDEESSGAQRVNLRMVSLNSKEELPLAWISAKSYQKLLDGVTTDDYAFVCRVSAGATKPRLRDSAGWVPLFDRRSNNPA